MPLKVGMRPNGSTIAFSASASFSLGLDSIPFTLTELYLDISANITTTAAPGVYDDGYDRIITDLSLNKGGITYVGVANLRFLYHGTRFRDTALKRPVSIAASQTAVTQHFGYRLHFGNSPWTVDATGRRKWNAFDLTGGIPPAGKGDLVLSGHWAAALGAGSGTTTNAATTITPYFVGLGQLPGEPDSAYMPQAFPAWQSFNYNGDVASTSTAKATREDIPIGDFLAAATVITRQGAAPNDVRSDAVLTDWQIFDTVGARDIWSVNAWLAGIMYQQARTNGWPVAENEAGTLGTPSLNQVADQGLLPFDFLELASAGDPNYGVNLTSIQKSTLQWRFGVASASNAFLDVMYFKYVKNPGLVAPSAGYASPSGAAIAIAPGQAPFLLPAGHP